MSYSGATGTSVTLGGSTTITPTTLKDGGKTATCSISPDLPTGLTLHSSTCVTSGTFVSTRSYLGGSTNHTVTLDPSSGRVIVAGGLAGIPVDTIAIFDDLGVFTFTTFHLPTTRSGHTASLLSNGNILFTGGMRSLNPGDILMDAELYSLGSGILPTPAAMTEPRVWHTATVLDDGRVMVIGGETTTPASHTTEIYQP